MEIHQQALTSSDVSFDFELVGQAASGGSRIELGRFGDEAVLFWRDPSFRLQEAPRLPAPSWTNRGESSPVPVPLTPPGAGAEAQRAYRLVK